MRGRWSTADGLSTPTPYVHSSLNTPDASPFKGKMAPGTNCDDAPISRDGRSGWFLNTVGDGFVVLTFGGSPEAREISFGKIRARVAVVGADLIDEKGVLADRYDGAAGNDLSDPSRPACRGALARL